MHGLIAQLREPCKYFSLPVCDAYVHILTHYLGSNYSLCNQFKMYACLEIYSILLRTFLMALSSKLVRLHGNPNLSNSLHYICLVILELQICLHYFLLTHGYFFQLLQLPFVSFDRGKMSKRSYDRMNQRLDLRTSRSKEGGNDTTSPWKHP